MDIFTRGLWIITGIGFTVSIIKDKEKTFRSMKMAKGMMKNMMGQIIGILFLIGLILTFIPPEIIKQYLGGANVLTASILSAFIGSITLIPPCGFPLVGSLVDMGASIVPKLSFNHSTMGFATFPLKSKSLGLNRYH